ncbi:hypothetical protein [Streptomyces hydrogenans]|uniref:hypothetical protein n=1 Tax=Streptomyces hydrogenans TaxID=1873719 RepID=UPI0027DF542D|nr:hypothetical protein [Streptomyces hydrogenans]
MHTGHADLVAFGTPFIANPDLVRRYRENLPLAAADPATYYGGGETGYTDYPFHRADGGPTCVLVRGPLTGAARRIRRASP